MPQTNTRRDITAAIIILVVEAADDGSELSAMVVAYLRSSFCLILWLVWRGLEDG